MLSTFPPHLGLNRANVAVTAIHLEEPNSSEKGKEDNRSDNNRLEGGGPLDSLSVGVHEGLYASPGVVQRVGPWCSLGRAVAGYY